MQNRTTAYANEGSLGDRRMPLFNGPRSIDIRDSPCVIFLIYRPSKLSRKTGPPIELPPLPRVSGQVRRCCIGAPSSPLAQLGHQRGEEGTKRRNEGFPPCLLIVLGSNDRKREILRRGEYENSSRGSSTDYPARSKANFRTKRDRNSSVPVLAGRKKRKKKGREN